MKKFIEVAWQNLTHTTALASAQEQVKKAREAYQRYIQKKAKEEANTHYQSKQKYKLLGEAQGFFTSAIEDANRALKEAGEAAAIAQVKLILKDSHFGLAEVLEATDNKGGAVKHYRIALDFGESKAQDKLKQLGIQESNPSLSASSSTPSSIASPVVSLLGSQNIQISAPVIFTQNSSVAKPTASVKPGGELLSTEQLAHCLQSNPESPQAEDWKRLAHGVIDEFSRVQDKTAELIAELVVVAELPDAEILHSILNSCTTALKDNFLLSQDLLEGLAKSLRFCNPALLRPEDLVRILNALTKLVQDLHQQFSSQANVETHRKLLKSLGNLLDNMADAGVEGLKRVELHEPLYNALGTYLEGNRALSYGAHYCRQALVRLSNDETQWQKYLRKTIGVGKGLAALWNAVRYLEPSSLLAAYTNLSEAAYHQESAQPWYDDIRYARLLIEVNRLQEFERFIKTAPHHLEQGFVFGVIIELQNLINQHADTVIRGQALSLLGQFFSYYSDWFAQKGLIDKVQHKLCNTLIWEEPAAFLKEILQVVLSYTSHEDLGKVAQELLTTWQQEDNPLKKRVIQENAGAALPPPVPPVKAGNRLFLAAQRSPLHNASTSGQLNRHRERVLNYIVDSGDQKNEDLEQTLALYIPAMGLLSPNDTKPFELLPALEQFLGREQEKVFLLLGDSGSGKTLFGRLLERQLWERFTPGSYIPLFVDLKAIQEPEINLIEKALAQSGFEPQHIKELKRDKLFLILDGYDEIRGQSNLYKENNLACLNVKVMISCRSEYLLSKKESYQGQFAPLTAQGVVKQANFSERYMAPFSPLQIDSYLQNYTKMSPEAEWKDWQEYRQYIESIGGLKALITSPFLLHITVQVLPGIVEANRQQADFAKVTRYALYEAFINRWFNRQLAKLKKRLDVDDLYSHAQGLSECLYTENLNAVIYDKRDRESVRKWKDYFGDEAEVVTKRLVLPLHKELKDGNYLYSFLHKSLLEFFYSRSIFEQSVVVESARQPESKETAESQQTDAAPQLQRQKSNISSKDLMEKLSTRLLNQEPSVLNFLVDRLGNDENLKEELWSIIRASKNNPSAAIAAANAATILNRAGVAFSNYDLSGTHLSGADLSGGIFDGTNFEGANLSNVAFVQAWLSRATFKNANCLGMHFGEWPAREHKFSVTALCYSADGHFLAVAAGKLIVIYDAKTLQKLRTHEGHNRKVNALAYSPDGRFLASGSADNTVKVWDGLGAELTTLHTHTGHGREVSALAYSPDGRFLTSGSSDNTVKVWDGLGAELTTLRTHEGHNRKVNALAYSPDGRFLASGSSDNTVKVWDGLGERGDALRTHTGHGCEVSALAYSPDGRFLASGSYDQTMKVWDGLGERGNALRTHKGHDGRIDALAYSPDGHFLASGAQDSTVKVWDGLGARLEVLRTHEGHSEAVNALAYSSDGCFLASGSSDKTLKVWDGLGTRGDALPAREGHKYRANALAYSPDGRFLASGSWDKTVKVWDGLGEKGGAFRTHEGHSSSVTSLAYSPDGCFLASGAEDSTVKVWDGFGEKRDALRTHEGHSRQVNALVYSPDGHLLVSGSGDKTLKVWDGLGEKRDALRTHEGQGGVTVLAYSPDGRFLASGSEDDTVKVWDGLGMRMDALHIHKGHSHEVNALAYSPDGRFLASGSYDKSLKVWDGLGEKRDALRTHEGHIGEINALAYSPDGRFLASGSSDNTVKVWDGLANSGNAGSSLADVQADAGEVRTLCYNPKYPDLFATGHGDGNILQWKVGQGAQFTLIWRAKNIALTARSLNLDGAHQLSPFETELLRQKGAVGEPCAFAEPAVRFVITSESLSSQVEVAQQAIAAVLHLPSSDNEEEKGRVSGLTWQAQAISSSSSSVKPEPKRKLSKVSVT